MRMPFIRARLRQRLFFLKFKNIMESRFLKFCPIRNIIRVMSAKMSDFQGYRRRACGTAAALVWDYSSILAAVIDRRLSIAFELR